MILNSVLIVDDNEADRYLISRLIRRAKLTEHIFEAKDGIEGLEFFSDRAAQELRLRDKFPPILVFLDINMPRANGFQFLEEFEKIRTKDNYESVVFMMFSSSERTEDRLRANSFDSVKGFITKMPRDEQDLVSTLTEAGLELA